MRLKPILCCAALLATTPTVIAQESPKALQDAFMDAVRAHDADALAALYTEDAVNFTVDQLVGRGPESARASWSAFFEGLEVLEAELYDHHLETHGDIAVAWGLFRIKAQPRAGGEPVLMEGRFMDVARNVDGRWLYVADHASMPLPAADAENGR